jgi:hypothetical protein
MTVGRSRTVVDPRARPVGVRVYSDTIRPHLCVVCAHRARVHAHLFGVRTHPDEVRAQRSEVHTYPDGTDADRAEVRAQPDEVRAKPVEKRAHLAIDSIYLRETPRLFRNRPNDLIFFGENRLLPSVMG